jgi:hypothetical protein
MALNIDLSAAEFHSLEELGKGVLHNAIPNAHSVTLIARGFAFKLLGQTRITKAGRARLRSNVQKP